MHEDFRAVSNASDRAGSADMRDCEDRACSKHATCSSLCSSNIFQDLACILVPSRNWDDEMLRKVESAYFQPEVRFRLSLVDSGYCSDSTLSCDIVMLLQVFVSRRSVIGRCEREPSRPYIAAIQKDGIGSLKIAA